MTLFFLKFIDNRKVDVTVTVKLSLYVLVFFCVCGFSLSLKVFDKSEITLLRNTVNSFLMERSIGEELVHSENDVKPYLSELFLSEDWSRVDPTFKILSKLAEKSGSIDLKPTVLRIPSLNSAVIRNDIYLHGIPIEGIERVLAFTGNKFETFEFSGFLSDDDKFELEEGEKKEKTRLTLQDFHLSFEESLETLRDRISPFVVSETGSFEPLSFDQIPYVKKWLLYGGTLIPVYKTRVPFKKSKSKHHISNDISTVYDVLLSAKTGQVLRYVNSAIFVGDENKANVFDGLYAAGTSVKNLQHLVDASATVGRKLKGKFFDIHNCCWRFECKNGGSISGCTNDMANSKCAIPGVSETPEAFEARTWGYNETISIEAGLFFGCNPATEQSWANLGYSRNSKVYFEGPSCSLDASAESKTDGWQSYTPPAALASDLYKDFDPFAEIQVYYGLNKYLMHIRDVLGSPFYCFKGSGMECGENGNPILGADGKPKNPMDVLVNLKTIDIEISDLMSQVAYGVGGRSSDKPAYWGPNNSSFFKTQFANAFFLKPIEIPAGQEGIYVLIGQYFLRSDGMFGFGEWESQSFRWDLSEFNSVTFHEGQHAVTHSLAPSLNSASVLFDSSGIYDHHGTLHEAYSDYFTLSFLNSGVLAPALKDLARDIRNDMKFPDNVTAESHHDGQIYSAALWKIRKVFIDIMGLAKYKQFDAVVLKLISLSTQTTTVFSSSKKLIELLEGEVNNVNSPLYVIKSSGRAVEFIEAVKRIFSYHGLYDANGLSSVGYPNLINAPRIIDFAKVENPTKFGMSCFSSCPSQIGLLDVAPFTLQYKINLGSLEGAFAIHLKAYDVMPDEIHFIYSEGCPIVFEGQMGSRPKAYGCRNGVSTKPTDLISSSQNITFTTSTNTVFNAVMNIAQNPGHDYYFTFLLKEKPRKSCYLGDEGDFIRDCRNEVYTFVEKIVTSKTDCQSLTNAQHRHCKSAFCPCTCNRGRYGTNCDPCPSCNFNAQCSESGVCPSLCDVYAAYGDVNCSKSCIKPGENVTCSGKGYCDSGANGKGCICKNGFRGEFCDVVSSCGDGYLDRNEECEGISTTYCDNCKLKSDVYCKDSTTCAVLSNGGGTILSGENAVFELGSNSTRRFSMFADFANATLSGGQNYIVKPKVEWDGLMGVSFPQGIRRKKALKPFNISSSGGSQINGFFTVKINLGGECSLNERLFYADTQQNKWVNVEEACPQHLRMTKITADDCVLSCNVCHLTEFAVGENSVDFTPYLGTYTMAACDPSVCCCMNDKVVIGLQGDNVTLNANFTGVCAGGSGVKNVTLTNFEKVLMGGKWAGNLNGETAEILFKDSQLVMSYASNVDCIQASRCGNNGVCLFECFIDTDCSTGKCNGGSCSAAYSIFRQCSFSITFILAPVIMFAHWLGNY